MADVVDPATRSRMMSGIGRRDTAPELRVRRYLHGAGLRFRVNVAHLPGRPDVVLPRVRMAVFVHGCFWHRHPGCRLAAEPATRTDFWNAKFDANVQRDRRVVDSLRANGWVVRTIWECESRDEAVLDALVWEILALSEAGTRDRIVPELTTDVRTSFPANCGE
ncbi:MAG: very short patch repair endonuclease [Betaproteobacteria bacterium]